MREKAAAMFAQLPLITREVDWTTQALQAHVFFFLLFFSSHEIKSPCSHFCINNSDFRDQQ